MHSAENEISKGRTKYLLSGVIKRQIRTKKVSTYYV